MEFKVGDTIYRLKFKTAQDGTINGILSTTYVIIGVGADRVLAESCNEIEYVNISHIENQEFVWGELADAEDEVLSRYMWTTDIDSGMKKMIEESIDICSDKIKQFSNMSSQLITMYKSIIRHLVEVKPYESQLPND